MHLFKIASILLLAASSISTANGKAFVCLANGPRAPSQRYEISRLFSDPDGASITLITSNGPQVKLTFEEVADEKTRLKIRRKLAHKIGRFVRNKTLTLQVSGKIDQDSLRDDGFLRMEVEKYLVDCHRYTSESSGSDSSGSSDDSDNETIISIVEIEKKLQNEPESEDSVPTVTISDVSGGQHSEAQPLADDRGSLKEMFYPQAEATVKTISSIDILSPNYDKGFAVLGKDSRVMILDDQEVIYRGHIPTKGCKVRILTNTEHHDMAARVGRVGILPKSSLSLTAI